MDRDPAYLLDMLNAARDIQALSTGLTEQAFQSSKLHQYALVKLIEIIGGGTSHHRANQDRSSGDSVDPHHRHEESPDPPLLPD